MGFIHWNVSPEIFEIFGREIRWYGVLFALGFVFGHRILTNIFKIDGRTEEDVEKLTMYMIIGVVGGARLGHCLFYDFHYYFIENPIKILYIWEGGLASHGAGLGIMLAIFFFSKKNKFDYLWLLDRIAIVVALAGFFIRFGNLMNSEIVGHVTDMPWGFKFMQNDCYPNLDCAWSDIPARHPSQLYEALSMLLLFVSLIWLYYKTEIKLHKGKLMGIYLIVVFTLRFCYEFLKENQSAFEDGMALNMGQILSIPMVIIGLGVFFKSKKEIE